MRGPLDISRELLDAEILHEFVHLPRRIDDAAELPTVLGLGSASCVAVRLYDTDLGLVAALVPAPGVVATTALARATGATRVRVAAPDAVIAATDCHPSLVSPIGLAGTVTVVADEMFAKQEVVVTATGDGSTALKIRAADLLSMTRAGLAPLVEPGAIAPS